MNPNTSPDSSSSVRSSSAVNVAYRFVNRRATSAAGFGGDTGIVTSGFTSSTTAEDVALISFMQNHHRLRHCFTLSLYSGRGQGEGLLLQPNRSLSSHRHQRPHHP